MKHFLPILALSSALFGATASAAPDETPKAANEKALTDIVYKTGALDDYEKERCKLDLYLPQGQTGFATVVWFHGGSLKAGNKKGDKSIAESLVKAGVALVSAEYRLSPKVKYPAYVQDAAAAFAWTHDHIAEYGGDPRKVFIGGHSAGGYLAFMVGLDPRYLQAFGVGPSALAGVIPVSGQTMTHYTVREERGIGQYTITADEAAPVFYVRKETPPMLVLYADHDMAARAEENAYLVAIMKGAGNEHVSGLLIHDRTHNTIASQIAEEADPARLAILEFIKAQSEALPPKAAGQ